MPMTVGAGWLAERIEGPRAGDVHAGLAALISSGELRPGTQLPTIRSLAGELGTRTSAVVTAWGMLRREGLVETHRRGGTMVLGGEDAVAAPARRDGAALDLVDAQADPELLPDLRDALLWATRPPRHAVKTRTTTRELLVAAAAGQPFSMEAFTVLPGGLAAINALIKAAARGGRDVIALESPTLMRTVTVVKRHASRILPLLSDASGPLPDSLREVLVGGARTIVFQPAWSVPSGATLTPERAEALAEILSGPSAAGVWVIEEDAIGPLARGATLGALLPDRVMRVTQYRRAFGPDMEIALVGGPNSIVDPLREAQRAAGLRVSPLLQDTLAYLLRDDDASAAVARAAARYAARHATFTEALRGFGLADRSAGGLVAVIPVESEARAIDLLAAAGLTVASLSRGRVDPGGEQAIRIAMTAIPDEPHGVRDLVAAIAAALREEVTVDGD